MADQSILKSAVLPASLMPLFRSLPLLQIVASYPKLSEYLHFMQNNMDDCILSGMIRIVSSHPIVASYLDRCILSRLLQLIRNNRRR